MNEEIIKCGCDAFQNGLACPADGEGHYRRCWRCENRAVKRGLPFRLVGCSRCSTL